MKARNLYTIEFVYNQFARLDKTWKKGIENPVGFCYNQDRQRHCANLPIINLTVKRGHATIGKALKIHTFPPNGFSVRQRQKADFFMPLPFPGPCS